MLKRTITLLGLTLTVGALLLALGCGGASNPISDNPTFTTRGGQPPSAPFVVVPRDGTVFAGIPVTFMLRATDPEGDSLKYKIELLKDGNVVAVYDQTQNPKGWRVLRFGSYEWVIFRVAIEPGDYQWRAQAFDGSNWGPYTNLHSFSVQ